jgi:amidohydrolase
MTEFDLRGELAKFLAARGAELIAFRRDLHAHPETGYREYRTSGRVLERLAAAGLRPLTLPKGTGLVADVGGGADGAAGAAGGPVVALRADLDALPMPDEKDVPYRSTVPNACHACGHDVHTTVLLGAGLFLAERAAAGGLPGVVRLVFQPAEEVPGGALDVMAAGRIANVERIFALHCDPSLDVGRVGTRVGPITGACDKIKVKVSGLGGHTARPHLTADLVYALGKIVTELPAALSRRVDPRSSLSLVWGEVSAGLTPNAIPEEGFASGTVRCLDEQAWHGAPGLLEDLVSAVSSAYGVIAEIEYTRGVPPAVNEPSSTAILETAAAQVLGPEALSVAPQSLGAEDFAWYLESVPGTLARLGTRTPGPGGHCDLHQATFDVDERAIGVGVRLMAATALAALRAGQASASGRLADVTSA